MIFLYDNGQQMVLTAPGCSPLSMAINIARQNLPKGATKFRIANSNSMASVWIS